MTLLRKSILMGLALLLILPVLAPVQGQSGQVELEFIVQIPYQLPSQARVYITGNHPKLGDWNPQQVVMFKVGPQKYAWRGKFPQGFRVQYKYTLGPWKFVEKGPRGEEIANRIAVANQSRKIYNQVSTWHNIHMLASTLPTWTGHIETIYKVKATKLGNERTVWVYLPPSYYHQRTKSYPVLYMHDGNNLFNARSAFGGAEWQVDEAVDRLIKQKKIPEIIVVAVANTSGRMKEYTPVKDSRYGGGGGDKYVHFLISELKPLIDSRYRTKPGRDHTAVMGSSLGGLMSLYLGWKHAKTFSKVGVVSPSIWWANRYALGMVQKSKPSKPLKVWLDMGTKESGRDANKNGVPDTIEEVRMVKKALEKHGWSTSKDLGYWEVPGGRHNEYSWSKRIDKILLYLYN